MVTGETETLADSACDYILTEEDYLRLEKKYGPIEDPWISTLEVNGKTYYYRTLWGERGTGSTRNIIWRNLRTICEEWCRR